MSLLSVKDLHVSVDGKQILNGIDLEIGEGEIHAVMGPNGSGKSTLSYVLSGREGYDVTQGEILFKGENVLDMEPHERAGAGIYLAFQYPVEIPGVSNLDIPQDRRECSACSARPGRTRCDQLPEICP